MIERGLLALMIIFSVNAVLIVSGVAGNFDNPQASLNLLPTGLTPADVNSSAIDLTFQDAEVGESETTLFTGGTAAVVDFLISLPYIGQAINIFITLAAVFLKFLFYWAIVLDISGLPAEIIFIIKVPLVVFQFGVLFFVMIQIIGVFTGAFR